MKPDRRDLIFLALLGGVLLIVAQFVRRLLGDTPAQARETVTSIVQDGALLLGIYAATRFALRLNPWVAAGVTAGSLTLTATWPWIKRALAEGSGIGHPCSDRGGIHLSQTTSKGNTIVDCKDGTAFVFDVELGKWAPLVSQSGGGGF
jgi:hypothetical protein